MIAGIFTRTPSGWMAQAGGGPVVLRSPSGKDSVRLTGFDRDVSAQAASWQLKFKTGEVTWPVEARFDRITRILMIRFPEQDTPSWQLQWDVTATDIKPLADDVSRRPGIVRGFIAAGAGHPLAVQTFSPLTFQEKGALVELGSAPGPKPGVMGFFVFAGPTSAQLGWSLAAEKSCRKPPFKGKAAEGETERFFSCWMTTPHALMTIQSREDLAPSAALPRRLRLVIDQIEPLPLTLPPQGALHVRIPPARKARVFERRDADDQGVAEVTLEESQKAILVLTPRATGRATIQLRHKEARLDQPLLLTASAMPPHARDALVPILADEASRPLSPWHAWMSRWPRTFDLPEGSYDFELSHRLLGKPCRLKIELAAGQEKEWTCLFEPDSTQERDGAVVSADFVETWGVERAAASTHFGLALYRVATPRVMASEPGGVAVLEVVDPAQGYSAQVVSPTDELLTAFEDPSSKKRPHAVESLSRAYQKWTGSGLFVLGCPAPGVSPSEYARLVTSLKPDALQLIGCGSSARERELLNAVGKPVGFESAPIILPAATFSLATPRTPPLLTYFPREAFPLTPRPLTPSDWAPLLRAGRYGWGRDAHLLVKPQPEGGLYARKGRNVVLHFEARADSATEMRLVVSNENGVVHDRRIKPEELATLSVDFPMRSDRFWLRAELRTIDPQRAGEETALAGTGWIKLTAPNAKLKG